VAYPLLYDLVSDIAERMELPEPIVEFGSLQVEADQPHDLRLLFPGREFIGTDLRAGPGVDRLEDLRSLNFADGEVGTALCLETLEHCADPLTACREIHRVLAPGGICIVSSVMLIGIHAHPSDYWRFTPEGLRTLLEPFDDVDVASMGDPENPFFVYGAGAKGQTLDLKLAEMPSLARAQDEYEKAEGQVRIGPFRIGLRALGGLLRRELPRAARGRLRR
jgi:SAM-dependent methyltransferase